MGLKTTWLSSKNSKKRANFGGSSRNPFFFFGLMSFFLFIAIYLSCSASENLGHDRVISVNSLKEMDSWGVGGLFSNPADIIALETPDLKIMQNNTIGAIAVPSVVSGKVLGDVFGANNDQKEVIDYIVQPGDTLNSIAESHKISVNTLLWANDLISSSKLKTGDSLIILPVDGVLHIVNSGDTVSTIASKYKSKSDDIIVYNNLASQNDIYIGDILVVPGGVRPKQSAPVASSRNNKIPIANNYFIFPASGRITQGLHYYNAVDVANKCGSPIYATAAGVVQRAVSNGKYNLGMGNHITILHSNGVVTYYGHLMSVLVKPGDKVYTGQNIALMGGKPGMAGAGRSTGCHVHFQVMGAKNPLAGYKVGSNINYK